MERHGREIWADWPEDYTLEDASTYLIGSVIAFALRLRGIVCLHASAIAVGGQAIALMGAPGAVKQPPLRHSRDLATPSCPTM